MRKPTGSALITTFSVMSYSRLNGIWLKRATEDVEDEQQIPTWITLDETKPIFQYFPLFCSTDRERTHLNAEHTLLDVSFITIPENILAPAKFLAF